VGGKSRGYQGAVRLEAEDPRTVPRPSIRDASIQRFEYTFEAVWKLLKAHLLDAEGVVCASPKACFRQALPAGLLSEEEVLVALEMTDDRNRTVHTYHEGLADRIFERLHGYRDLMRRLFEEIAAVA
jgi:nucleotidyltransferase substrate binding protein (TIGR01987 family)